jgi:curved DNA-binding protein
VEKKMDYKDYYKTLHIAKEASQEEIKRAYRKLARKYHPDINKDASAEARFKEINEAHEVLKDKEKRQAYDSFGGNWQNGREFRPPPDWRDSFKGDGHGPHRASNQHYSDFFESLFGGHSGRFTSEDIFSVGQGYQGRGHDLNAKISISLEDSYHGANRTITLNRMVGDGNGGLTQKPQSLQLTIPKGIIGGQQIRLEGQGDTGFAKGPSGNLFLEIVFEAHPLFTVNKRDILFTLAVTPWEAALGATIAVPTLGGQVDLKLPANSQTGKKLRMKGRGLSSKTQVGNQYVTLAILAPPATTSEQREFYKKMAKFMPYNPRSGLEVKK